MQISDLVVLSVNYPANSSTRISSHGLVLGPFVISRFRD